LKWKFHEGDLDNSFIKNCMKFLALMLVFSSCTFDDDTTSSSSDSSTTITIDHPIPAKDSTGIRTNGTVLQWKTNAQIGTVFQVYLETTSAKGVLPTNSNWTTTPKGVGITTTTFAPGTLTAGTWYAWRVRALLSDGSWTDSPTWYFQTQNIIPSTGNLLSLKDVQTELFVNHKVKILFQASDIGGNGMTGLQLSDFEISEDGEPLRESELQFSNIQPPGINLNVRLLLDKSTSITHPGQLGNIQADASTLVATLSGFQFYTPTYFIYSFDESLDPPAMPQPMGTTNIGAAQAFINSITPGKASTDFNGSVADVARTMVNTTTLSNITDNILVVFSDGDDTAGKRSFADATNAVANKRVYTVGYSGDLREDILTKIGNSGFINTNLGPVSPHFNNIRVHLENLAQSYYILNYESPKRGFKNHTVSIRLRGSNNVLYVTYAGW
jgi:hypothetical protein